MIGIFDSGFGGLQTLKYLKAQFPSQDFMFLADNKNVPYGDKNEETIKKLTINNINWLLGQECEYIVIACNTAVASIYRHWFPKEIEQKLIPVTTCGIKQAILYKYKKIAVWCTQTTHNLKVYPTIYNELTSDGELYTIPTPELVPLIEADQIDYDKINKYVDIYKKHILPETDCLILGCTHYPILLDVFWENFPCLRIIDPGRSSIATLDKKLASMSLDNTKGKIQIYCTGSSEQFSKGAKKVRKTNDLPQVHEVAI